MVFLNNNRQIGISRNADIRIPLRFMLVSRCRAIVCSQYEQACEQAPACSIAPSGTARRNAQLRVCRDEPWNIKPEDNRTKTLWYCSNEQYQRDFYYSGIIMKRTTFLDGLFILGFFIFPHKLFSKIIFLREQL